MGEDRLIRTGRRGDYAWLTADGDLYLKHLLTCCPEVVLGRYLAVTEYDSGRRRLTREEESAGWRSECGIAYSPVITSVEDLRFQRDGLDSPGFDEWYVFSAAPEHLGEKYEGNYFDYSPGGGRVMTFASMRAFVLHEPEPYMPGILERFWEQIERLRPETYVADGEHCLTVVSRRVEVLEAARRVLI